MKSPSIAISVPNTRATVLITLLVLLFTLPGLIGHDPWKQDEAYVFGIVWHMVQSNDYIVPVLANEPFMEKPPLYYYVAALSLHTFSRWLPPHDAARLATGFFMLVTLLCIGLAGRELWDAARGRMAVLLLLGSAGLIDHAHEMITDMALLTGFAVGIYGLALTRRLWLSGGLLLGTGVGMGFLAKGLIAPGVLGVSALLLPLVARDWRHRNYTAALLLAAVATLPWLLIWPALLYERSPELFKIWLWDNNFGRYLGFAHLGAERSNWSDYLEILVWQAWPTGLLSIIGVWQGRWIGLASGATRLLLVLIGVLLLVLDAAAVERDLYSLPVLLPLALLGAPAVTRLPALLDRGLTACSILLFTMSAVFVWSVWLYIVIYNVPPAWHQLDGRLPLDFHLHFAGLPFTVALALSLGWLVALWQLRATTVRAVSAWTLGLTLLWGLLATLWLPWIDAAKSYRSMISDLQYALPSQYTCIASLQFGECERGMLDYLTGIVTHRLEKEPDANCDLLLIRKGRRERANPAPGSQWQPIWEGGRPGDHDERYFLFHREINPAIDAALPPRPAGKR